VGGVGKGRWDRGMKLNGIGGGEDGRLGNVGEMDERKGKL
jgi:hypothetical protein